jgi:hypothetical protein
LAQNDYQTFGDSGTDGTNKLSLTNYVADNDRIYGNGYTTKLLRSQLVNKVLQQTSKISSAVAQFLVNNGISALDTDSSAAIATNIDNALNASRNTATHAATSKTTPVGADEIAILDSASSFSLKKLTWGTFASIFAPLASPALTGTPTAPTATAGTNNTQLATAAFAMGAGVGSNQTWQDVTASRSVGTTYTNSTGKPIMVAIKGYGTQPADIVLGINGTNMMYQNIYNGTGQSGTVYGIIPNGSTYIASISAGTSTTKWSELR